MISIILNNKDIVIPIFKALDLNSELSRDLVRDASATALSADNNNSRTINTTVKANSRWIFLRLSFRLFFRESPNKGKKNQKIKIIVWKNRFFN